MQFEFAGPLNVADGRYLAGNEAEGEAQSVLVIETVGATPAPPRRRRRRPEATREHTSSPLQIGKATAVRAWQPFDSPEDASRWLEQELASESAIDALVATGIGLLNRALFAQATTLADPLAGELSATRALSVRIGYGSGEEVAAGRFTAAYGVDIHAGGSRRQQRETELRPQERVAAILRGREEIDACEALLLRARADLDGDRPREAALQLRVGLEALLVELAHALTDSGHEEDMAQLEARKHEVGEAANMALRGDLGEDQRENVGELLAICERVLRRRRVLRG